MSWKRRGKQSYYYSSRRVGDRVQTVYWGNNDIAIQIADVDKNCRLIKRLEQEQKRIEKECEEQEFRKVNEPVDRMLERTYQVVVALLMITHHHEHKGQWRRSRKSKLNSIDIEKEYKKSMIGIEIDLNNELDQEFESLLNAARKAKPGSKEVYLLRFFLNDHPELWHNISDLSSLTLNNFLEKETGSDPATAEIFAIKLQELKNNLGWAEGSSLVRVLIEAVVLSYARWCITEIKYTNIISQPHSFDQGAYWGRRLNNAQRAYLRSCETLARVKRLTKNCPELANDFSQQGMVM